MASWLCQSLAPAAFGYSGMRASNRRETGFAMGFAAKILQVDLDRIPKLLAQVRRYSELDSPPQVRDGCKDCERVKNLIDLADSD